MGYFNVWDTDLNIHILGLGFNMGPVVGSNYPSIKKPGRYHPPQPINRGSAMMACSMTNIYQAQLWGFCNPHYG